MKLKDLFIKYVIETPFSVDCKNDKLVFPSDKEQEYKSSLKEKIGEEEFKKLTASDRIVQCPENLENIALVSIETHPDISLIATEFLNDVQREYYKIFVDTNNKVKLIWHYLEIYFIGDVGWMPVKALMPGYRTGIRKIEPLPKIIELWPKPSYYHDPNWLKKNTACNNPNIDPKIMDNIVSLCGEVSIDLGFVDI
ncbi:hypothetical protein [Rickettsia tamurae]|uniref:hypothetical protein n=1 Tax=Rickettsia tamurae TaxID=334545 RepID=UPI000A51A0E5|nr:hypothetical protein [Rickettsia tamurae]